MLIKEFAEFTGVSVRTLHYYDEIGLLMPAFVDRTTGYRYYDENSLHRMQEILFYRELDFSLKSIGQILSSPNYDTRKSLQEQKLLLTLKKERLERLISSIDEAMKGENILMSVFDNSEFEKHKLEAQEKWGKTEAYRQHAEKTRHYSKQKWDDLAQEMDHIMAEFAICMKTAENPGSAEAFDPQSVCCRQAGHHRNTDARLHDEEPASDPCGGDRRCKRHLRRHECDHAQRRDRCGRVSDRGGEDDGAHCRAHRGRD